MFITLTGRCLPMTYIKTMEKALSYIEAHLREDIDLAEVAKTAGYSLYHFHRIFKGAVGDSLKDYIRKRRMTEAARELVDTSLPIVDIAVAYGYESREAFSRAFEKVYGRTPSEVRSGKLLYGIREPMTARHLAFEYNLRRGQLTPSFRMLPERIVAGKKWRLRADGSNLQEIPLIWQAWLREKESEKILDLGCPGKIMGICQFSDEVTFDYIIGQEVASFGHVPDGMEGFRLEQQTYAVFPTTGPFTETVQKTWDYIYSVWLSESEYEHAGTHDMEYYNYGKLSEPSAELYVPVVKGGKR